MHFQAAFCQAGLKFDLEGLRFQLTATVHQPVVCIPTPWEVGVCPPHPEVKIEKRQVYEAYKAVKSNKGAAGVDGQTIEQFDADLEGNLYKIWNRMSSGSYFPPPVRAVTIPKKSGGERILGVPTVGDRIAQMVIAGATTSLPACKLSPPIAAAVAAVLGLDRGDVRRKPRSPSARRTKLNAIPTFIPQGKGRDRQSPAKTSSRGFLCQID